MRTILMAVGAIFFAAGASSAATLVNGSFTGPLAIGSLPTGWSILSPSPDTNNQTTSGAGGTYFVAADNSNDGGTWVGFGRSGGTNEIISQTISDFTIGQTYNLSWEAGNFGVGSFPSFNNSNSISVLLDGSSIGSGGALGVSSAWFDQSLTFTATATSQTLSFGLLSGVTSYMQLDGMKLTAAVSPIPIPAGGLLLVTALGAMGLSRRKRKMRA